MLFNSFDFILFLGAATVAFHYTPYSWRKYHLIIFSYLYYFSWSAGHALLLFGVSLTAYFTGLGVERAASEEGKKKSMALGVLLLAGVLFVFKYFNDFADFAAPGEGPVFYRILIPVGISYYTFRLISYVVDVYWGKITAERDLAAFTAFAAFFPHILSGPIHRAETFLPQLKKAGPVPYLMLTSGMRLILFGFFKKLVIADRLGIFVDTIYASPGNYNSLAILLAAYGFMIQLYADFSGLTDIARGSTRLLGFESPKNFDLPFYAPNIQQYWRRWHMSLTQWLGDYVFMPLRMKFRNFGNTGLVLAILINMTAIGLWHGARTTYLAFGLLHGIYMIGSALTLKRRDQFYKAHPLLARGRTLWGPLITFHLVILASIFFRAESLSGAWEMISGIAALDLSKAGPMFFAKREILILAVGGVIMEIVHYLESKGRIRGAYYSQAPWMRWAVLYGFTFFILGFGEFNSHNFIYFEF